MKNLLVVLALAGILPGGGDDEARPFPVEARGNIRFDLDAARFVRDGTLATEIYLGIPQMFLTHSPDSSGHAHIRIETEYRDEEGESIGEAAEEMYIPLRPREDGDVILHPRHLITLRPVAPPATSSISVRITDVEGRKTGLLDRLLGKRMSGRASGRFESTSPRCGFSDVAFLWSSGTMAAPTDNGGWLDRQPNPRRFYGLFHTDLLFYIESYGSATSLRYHVRAGRDGEVVLTGSAAMDSAAAIDASNGRTSFIVHTDLSAVPSGLYTVEIGSQSADTCTVRRSFEVLWETTSWAQDEKALLEEAFVILSPTEYERVQDMSRGEAEVYMRELWSTHDPYPSTAVNELYETYQERTQHADRFFGTSIRRGVLSDRGRVYVRYGPPDEITTELNPQDEDLLSKVLPQEMAEDRYDQVTTTKHRNARDNRGYEIWLYTMHGAPLFPDQEPPMQRAGMKFIFVDEMGYGDMRMVYTNLIGSF